MILSGQAIRERLGSDIIIDPFDETQLNPNSYNLTLHNELMVYEELMLDMARANRVRTSNFLKTNGIATGRPPCRVSGWKRVLLRRRRRVVKAGQPANRHRSAVLTR